MASTTVSTRLRIKITEGSIGAAELLKAGDHAVDGRLDEAALIGPTEIKSDVENEDE